MAEEFHILRSTTKKRSSEIAGENFRVNDQKMSEISAVVENFFGRAAYGITAFARYATDG